MEKATQKMSFLVLAGILSTYMVQTLANSVSPAMSALIAYYHNQPQTNVILIQTIPMFISIFANFLTFPIIKCLKYRETLILSVLCLIVGGIAPAFFPDNFSMVLVMRIIHGFGFGVAYPLSAAYVMALIPCDQVGKVMGWGVSVSSIVGIAFALVTGILAASYVHNIWWLNTILIVVLIFAFVIPEPKAIEVPEGEGKKNVKTKLPGKVYFWVIGNGVFMLFLYAFYIYISMIITSGGMGNSAQAGMIVTICSIAGIVAGVAFGKLYSAIKGRILGLGMLLTSVMFIAGAFSSNFLVVLACAFIGGFGSVITVVTLYTGAGIDSPPTLVSLTTGAMAAAGNLGGFASSYFSTLLASVFEQLNNFRFPFYLSMLFFLIFGAIFFIKSKKIGFQSNTGVEEVRI